MESKSGGNSYRFLVLFVFFIIILFLHFSVLFKAKIETMEVLSSSSQTSLMPIASWIHDLTFAALTKKKIRDDKELNRTHELIIVDLKDFLLFFHNDI